MKNQNGFTLVELGILIFAILAIIGYILNIVKIVNVVNTQIIDITILLVFRIIGIFAAPLGCILGYF